MSLLPVTDTVFKTVKKHSTLLVPYYRVLGHVRGLGNAGGFGESFRKVRARRWQAVDTVGRG